jgi:uncharacterized membrane protein
MTPDAKPARLDSVDLLRGIAMVLMALDHVRDFFHSARFDPLDLTQTSTLLFMTRWVTHHCAPTFVFLAGTGAFLSLGRGRSKSDLTRFLLSRGLWLVFLEVTAVRFGWLFNVDYSFSFGQVIWAIGWSMIALAGLIHLPRLALVIVALGMIVFHNAFDGVTAASFGNLGWLWQILHIQSPILYAPEHTFWVIYPLIPWIGVMAAGSLLGPILQFDERKRRKTLLLLGLGIIATFIVVRATNLYGDPSPWTSQSDIVRTLLSFINTTKYPPSLLYLCMTIGPAIAVLPLFERWKGKAADFFIVFGRVPLFYYVLHIPLIHILAVLAAVAGGFPVGFLFSNVPPGTWDNSYGFSLPIVYLVWVGVIFVLYAPCAWFARVKKRRRDVWLSYL